MKTIGLTQIECTKLGISPAIAKSIQLNSKGITACEIYNYGFDYKTQGLTAKEAIAKIKGLKLRLSKNYSLACRKKVKGNKRYLQTESISEKVNAKKHELYKLELAAERMQHKINAATEIQKIEDANIYLKSWNLPNAKIQISGKIVLLERIEAVVWGEYKSNRTNWPTSKTVSYRATKLTAKNYVEKEITFSRIRNWEAKLIKELI
jgi:hypothetical protein